MEKYELTNETINFNGKVLYRIKSLRDLECVRKGEIGGYVESERNLSQYGECWVGGNSKVYEKARIIENARILENSNIYGNAILGGDIKTYDNSEIGGSIEIKGDIPFFDARIIDKANVYNVNLKNENGEIIFFATFYRNKYGKIMISDYLFDETIEEYLKEFHEGYEDEKLYPLIKQQIEKAKILLA